MWKVDPQHTGLNSQETILTPALVGDATKFAPLFAQKLDGQVYGAPLFMSAATLNKLPGTFRDGKSHNVVYVVTQHDSVYAFDGDAQNIGPNDSAPLWHTSFLVPNSQLGTPTSVPSTDANGNDITPEFGISTTPVIDPVSGTLYVVSLLKFPGQSLNNLYRQELHALDLKTGLDKVTPFVLDANLTFQGTANTGTHDSDQDPVTAPIGQIPFSPLHEHLRAAMAFDSKNHIVYLAYASHSDEMRYYGLVLGFDSSTLKLIHSFVTTPNGSGTGGIWQGGASVALDENQNIVFVTGNGQFDQDPSTGLVDWGESALKLPAAMDGQQQFQLAITDTNSFFTPFNWALLNQGGTVNGHSINGDSDLGAGGPLLLPTQQGEHPHMMLFGGKEGTWYLIDRDILGGVSIDDPNSKQPIQLVPEPDFPQLTLTPSYFNGAVYYASGGHPMERLKLVFDAVDNVTKLETAPTLGTGGNINNKGASPFITSNGTLNGIAWAIDGNLKAYDANTLQLISTGFNGDISAPDGSGRCQTTKFNNSLAVANGHAYYTCFSGTSQGFLFVAGLKAAAAVPPAAPTALSATAVSSTAINLSWTNNAANDPSLAGFHVSRATSANGPFTVLNVSAQGTTFADSTLSPNTQYFYQVSAFNSADSSPSNTASATTFPSYTQPGLVGFWPMEDGTGNTVSDASGNGHSGSLPNGGESLFTSDGYINDGVAFHGTTIADNITVPDSSDLDFTASQSFTLATWVRLDAITGVEQPIVLKSANNGNVYGLLFNGNNQFVMRGPAGDVAGTVAATKGVWAHVAMVQDGTANTRTLYVNGQAVANGVAQDANGPGALEWGEEDLPSGSDHVQFGFQGVIDETRLYNRALSASEIADLLPVTLLDASSMPSPDTTDQLGTTLFPIKAPVSEARISKTAGSYTVVAHFAKAVTGISPTLTQKNGGAQAQGVVGTPIYDSTQTSVSIPLTGVANSQQLNLHLSGILAADQKSVVPGTADITFQVLAGDVNGDGVVDNNDVSLENASITNASVLPTNAAFDINGDGLLNSADVSLLLGQTPGGQTPPAAPANLTATVGTSSVGLSWSPSNNAISYTLFRGTSSGNEFQLMQNLTGTQFTDNNVIPGTTYFYKVEAVNGAGPSSFSNEAQAVLPGNNQTAVSAVIQIDSGSTTAVGTFVADEFVSGGNTTGNVGVPIDTSRGQNLAPMEVYQTNRFGTFTYTIPNLTSGTSYILRLHFAETFWTDPGSRLFDILVNGQTVQSNFDIVAAAGGKDVAISVDYPVTAQNGQVAITFQTVKDNALVSGLELLNTATQAPSTSLVYQVDSGSAVSAGVFFADSSFSGGNTSQTNDTITTTGVKNAAPAAVYQSNRFGTSTYTFTGLKTGSPYIIRSHFAETYWNAPGARLFNILINDQVAQSNYDIFATAGGKDIATTLDLPATAQNGQITVQYQTVKDNALVSGIEVIGDGSMMPRPNAPTSLHAAAGVGRVALTWASAASGTYSVFRGNAAGSEATTPIASGLTGTSFIDANLPNGQPFFYTVQNANATVASFASSEVSATPGSSLTGAPVYRIAAGSVTPIVPFQADAFFAGGGTATGAGNPDLSAVVNPAPEQVYQQERAGGTITYTLPNLLVGTNYKLRLHFNEFYWKQPGQRVFNVIVNGDTVLPNFDIIAAAGAPGTAIVEEFTVQPDPNGNITVTLSGAIADQPKISALELYR
ncbi:Fibronectin type III domain protein [Terriglobus saanensis SP1PR4]|uniref:Fibronectin type III domain protein n=2 Tax=Terriglobus saanensis TaxID=870903 RepID=E8UXA6_TERSS|nr:Fibronectin type III domain protein [Terriglobus saanensis SP1PR4]